jgi:hypothetical protein
MSRFLWFRVLLGFGAVLGVAGLADAERVPSAKAITLPSTGARPDVTVPYTTNGRSTLGVYSGVSPRVADEPGLGENNDAQVRMVYNLPFYGAKQSFNAGFFGAVQGPFNSLRPGR